MWKAILLGRSDGESRGNECSGRKTLEGSDQRRSLRERPGALLYREELLVELT